MMKMEWLEIAKENNCTHLIVACDTFHYGDYPIYCFTDKECLDEYDAHDGKNMQVVIEVYDMKLDLGMQKSEHRAKHLPKRS